MVTEFGKLLRIIRINTGDSARTMAEKFGMSPSYLSTIENGKRNIPPEMEELVIRAYDLSEHDKEKLRKTIIDTTAQLKVNLTEIVGKSKLLDFPTMPTTAESLPLLIYFFLYTLNLYLVKCRQHHGSAFGWTIPTKHHSRQQKTF